MPKKNLPSTNPPCVYSLHNNDTKDNANPRQFPKRFGAGDSGSTSSTGSSSNPVGGRPNPFSTISPLTTGGIASPTAGTGVGGSTTATASSASNAFGLGSGAFGFGAAPSKTPKTPGTAFDWSTKSHVATSATPVSTNAPSTPIDKARSFSRTSSLRGATGTPQGGKSTSSSAATAVPTTTANISAASAAVAAVTADHDTAPSESSSTELGTPWPLKYTWMIWYRPPTSKPSDYNPRALCEMGTAQQFWKVFSHLKRPSALPTVSDYHFFKAGIRPIWEDDENKKGGKWIMRLKKGVADRYWEELLLAMIGDQFAEAGEEVCGAVVSVRSGEDVFSIWTKNDGGRNIKIRETIKRVLSLPMDTNIIWKSHEESSTQTRPTGGNNQNRHEKTGQQPTDRRRVTISAEEHTPIKERQTVT